MRRKNRKWVAIAVAMYLFLLLSAYRWGKRQPLPDGDIVTHLAHEGVKRMAAEKAKKEATEAAELASQPQPSGASRLAAAGPAYVAARYDDTHVVFIVAPNAGPRYSSSPLMGSRAPARIPAASHPSAPLAGLQELWEGDPGSMHFYPKIIQNTPAGDLWTLDVSPGLTIPVAIDRAVIAPTGCSLALGFLASIPREQQNAFASAAGEYFPVRHRSVEPADPSADTLIAELRGWKISRVGARPIEEQLTARMKKEVSSIDAELNGNAPNQAATANESPIGNIRAHLKEWLRIDQALIRGDGTLDYDLRAFTLTPDRAPRLFVRARWTLAGAPVFLMTAWFKISEGDSSPKSDPILLFADSSWAKAMREGTVSSSLADSLEFQSILNEFDADRDGWAELLVYSAGLSSPASSTLGLYLYTDHGLLPMKEPLQQSTQSRESCVN